MALYFIRSSTTLYQRVPSRRSPTSHTVTSTGHPPARWTNCCPLVLSGPSRDFKLAKNSCRSTNRPRSPDPNARLRSASNAIACNLLANCTEQSSFKCFGDGRKILLAPRVMDLKIQWELLSFILHETFRSDVDCANKSLGVTKGRDLERALCWWPLFALTKVRMVENEEIGKQIPGRL